MSNETLSNSHSGRGGSKNSLHHYRDFVFWILLIAGVIQAAVILQAHPLQSANDRSRWCAVWSIVERGTFQIDEIRRVPGWDTIDMVKIDGHFYSTKPPMLAMLAAGIYAPLRLLGWDLIQHTQWVSGITLLILNLVPYLGGLWLISRVLPVISNGLKTAIVVLVVLTFGTMAIPFLATLNNHVPAFAISLMVLWSLTGWLVSLMPVVNDVPEVESEIKCALRQRSPELWASLTGLLTGLLFCFELPAAVLLVAIPCVRICFNSRRGGLLQEALGFGCGAALPLGAFLFCNFVASGEVIPLYASYGTERYRFVEEGVPSYWMEPQGVDLNLDSFPVYLFHCLAGHHGLFSQMPFLLLAIPAWIMILPSTWKEKFRWNLTLQEQLGLLALATWVIVLSFYMTRTQNYNYGGVSVTLRWALWLVPFGMVSAATRLTSWFSTWPRCTLVVGLASLSIFSAWLPLGNPWQQPWIFTAMARQGWLNYQQAPPPFKAELSTWFSSIPAERASAVWQAVSPTGLRQTLRLETTGEVRQQGENRYTRIDVEESTGDWNESPQIAVISTKKRTLWIDREGFMAGKSPANILRWFEPVTLAQQLDDLNFLRGLPLFRPYAPGPIRYLKTPLRRDAFRTQRAASEVTFPQEANAKSTQPVLRYRRDLWLSDEVPFGTIQWEQTLRDAQSGQLVATQTWQMIQASPAPAPNSPLSSAPAASDSSTRE
ncbi:hypothetical protein [Planctopirus hydrillae]|uniref:Glycosyltransferase RgtA/B/C/D-like domain-containing protein n=1 Tax=Planctopirus hydrillae TaxID=1841610 RepID=A0A1C3E581_9PLAN|nr:hypothetical protein [Planctopirus hydrillae]ODA28406.1 hypothetical protein A6X21_11760 [Planctopirus hydrillae]